MLNQKVDFDNEQLMHEQLLGANRLIFGALAWRGYLLKSRGAVVIYALEESKYSFEQSLEVEVGYLSRDEAVQNYPQGLELFQLVDNYNPSKEMVITFTDSERSLINCYCLRLAVPPPKCYAILEARLSEFDI